MDLSHLFDAFFGVDFVQPGLLGVPKGIRQGEAVDLGPVPHLTAVTNAA